MLSGRLSVATRHVQHSVKPVCFASEIQIGCCIRRLGCNALKFLIAGEEIIVREGELLHIPSWVEHQAVALEDTFELDVFSPIRADWLGDVEV